MPWLDYEGARFGASFVVHLFNQSIIYLLKIFLPRQRLRSKVWREDGVIPERIWDGLIDSLDYIFFGDTVFWPIFTTQPVKANVGSWMYTRTQHYKTRTEGQTARAPVLHFRFACEHVRYILSMIIARYQDALTI